MKRLKITPRRNWQQKVAKQGFLLEHVYGKAYWEENACYAFTNREIDVLDAAAQEAWQMCLKAAAHIIEHDRFAELRIPEEAIPSIIRTWKEEPPTIYARFDFGFDGVHPPKLFECNGDTPTTLLEAGVIQWYWLKDTHPDGDQFNWIYERLLDGWKRIKTKMRGNVMHFAHDNDVESLMTVAYLKDMAEQAGIETVGLHMNEIGWDYRRGYFTDLEENQITDIFKLFPWEVMIGQEFGRHLFGSMHAVNWIEPIWKMLFSNKALLAILWELFPGHPNLLEAHVGEPKGLRSYAQKPIFGCEGQNISIVKNGTVVIPESGGRFAKNDYVYQDLWPLPEFDRRFPVIGSWIINGESAGVGVCEGATLVNNAESFFVPHMIENS